jgi:hypothetical protein|tara:strand:- start:18 stop:431 length:414 start_codon:yes stop_codon:yes gene_type:complete
MSYFEKKFKTLLEQEVDSPVDIPAEEQMPAEPGMGPDADTAAVVNDTPDNPALNYRKEQSAQMTGSIEGWIGQIEEFNGFMNGLDGGSLQAQLNNADCDTIFNDIARSETKKISRIAQDLSALVESLKGYLLSHEDK